MINERTPAQILSHGVSQFCMFAPQATDQIATLRGALAYCQAERAALRDDFFHKEPSLIYVERIPAMSNAAVRDE